MDKQSLFFTSLVAVISTALMLAAINFLAKKQNLKSQIEQKISISFSIWTSSIMVAFFLFLKVALELIENSIELIIYSNTIETTFLSVMEKIMIFTGFTFIVTFVSYFIVHSLIKFSFGNSNDSIEMEKDNKGYFLIKAFVLIMLAFSLIPIYQDFLGWFEIKVETPFYH